MVGSVFHAIPADQFARLQDGDRFWYEGALPPEIFDLVKKQTLAVIIRRNTEIGDGLQDNVFLMPRSNGLGGAGSDRNAPRSQKKERRRRSQFPRNDVLLPQPWLGSAQTNIPITLATVIQNTTMSAKRKILIEVSMEERVIAMRS
jgi:hypothetical protein